jgi:hypothetical protein
MSLRDSTSPSDSESIEDNFLDKDALMVATCLTVDMVERKVEVIYRYMKLMHRSWMDCLNAWIHCFTGCLNGIFEVTATVTVTVTVQV